MECLKGIRVDSVAESWQREAEDEDGAQVRLHHRAYRAQGGILTLVFSQWKPPEYFKYSCKEIRIDIYAMICYDMI